MGTSHTGLLCTQDTGFFRGWGGAWDSQYGHFFMKWYSDQLLLHGQRLCKIASCIFNTSRPQRCTPRYHSTHPHSLLDPMSLVSDLNSMLRRSDQLPPSAPQSDKQPLAEPQSTAPLNHALLNEVQQPAKLLGRHSAGKDEATARSPDQPLTPASSSAPQPSSWPPSQRPGQAQSQDQRDQELLHSSSLQPADRQSAQPVGHTRHDLEQSSQTALTNSGSGPGSIHGQSPTSEPHDAEQVAHQQTPEGPAQSSAQQLERLQSDAPEAAASRGVDGSGEQCAPQTQDRWT